MVSERITSLVESVSERTGIDIYKLFEEISMVLNDKYYIYFLVDKVVNFDYVFKSKNFTFKSNGSSVMIE